MFTLQGGAQHAIAFNPTRNFAPDGSVVEHFRQDDITDSLHTSSGNGNKSPVVAFQTRVARNGRGQPKEITDALTSSDGGTHADSKPHVAGTFGVRRLTPRECERLQGFPDDWTRWDAKGNGLADSPRYRMMGNAVSVPPVEWIGRRIMRYADSIYENTNPPGEDHQQTR